LRVNKEAVGLRTGRIFRAIRRAFSEAREQFGFRLAQYSVQGNHIHLIAEANDRRALTRGMQGLTIRVALAVNRARGRKGRVFGDRYHARQLRTPLEVRRALLYVLRNDRKHLAEQALSLAPWRLDPCSSAHFFDGWQESALLELAKQCRARSHPATPDEPSTTHARSHLLRVGWQRHGLLGLEEVPGER
jgi:REP element-mobilizing transposase RayT